MTETFTRQTIDKRGKKLSCDVQFTSPKYFKFEILNAQKNGRTKWFSKSEESWGFT